MSDFQTRSAANAALRANKNASAKKRNLAMAALFAMAILAVAGAVQWWFSQPETIVELRVGTGQRGSDTYLLMHEINEVARRHNKPLRLTLVETLDPSEGVSLLNKGAIDLALIRSNTPVVSDTRMIATVFAEYFQLIVASESPIYRAGDITRGKLILPPFGTDGFRAFWSLMDHYNLPIDDLRWEAKPFKEASKLFLSGKVDGIFTLRSLRDPSLLRFVEDAIIKRKRLRFVPLDQARAMALKRPFLGEGLIPQGGFTGEGPLPQQDLKTVSVDRVLVTKEGADAKAIHALTEVMFENRLDLTIRNPLSQAIGIPDLTGGLSVPLHEGASQFYRRDEPSFIQENAEPIALGVTVMAMLVSGLLALRSRLQLKQKNTADVYNYQLLDMIRRTHLASKLDDLNAIKQELADVLETIVVALDADEITDEGFQSFALICDQLNSNLRDRRQELIAA